MADVTALELVNRVRRRMRWGVVDSIDDSDFQSQALLDLINASMFYYLDSKKWRFDLRHDGVIVTKSVEEAETAYIGNGVSGFADQNIEFTMSDWRGDFITRAIVTSDSDYGDISQKVVSAVTYLGSNLFFFSENAYWPGDTNLSAEIKLFVAEYLLPDDVREVVSVTHEGLPLTLRHIDPGATFDNIFPRTSDHFGEPEWVGVGGHDIGTYTYSGTPPSPKLRMVIYPVPEEETILKISYYVQRERLTAATDVLEAVPASLVEQIVASAAADAMSTLEKDVKSGTSAALLAERRVDKLHDANNPQPAAKYPVRSWNSRGRGGRTVHGFPGVTLSGPSLPFRWWN